MPVEQPTQILLSLFDMISPTPSNRDVKTKNNDAKIRFDCHLYHKIHRNKTIFSMFVLKNSYGNW